MQSSFDKAFEHTVGLEGGYSDHSADKGGKTKYGITEVVARENGYTGDMKVLPLIKAKEIYKKGYWDKLLLDDIAKISEPIANEIFDTAINMGMGTAGKFLQRALNVFQMKGSELSLDGVIGRATLGSLKVCIEGFIYEEIILKMLNAQQCMRYMEIVEKDPSQAVFLRGWISKRVGL